MRLLASLSAPAEAESAPASAEISAAAAEATGQVAVAEPPENELVHELEDDAADEAGNDEEKPES
jgi:hypothetical protein